MTRTLTIVAALAASALTLGISAPASAQVSAVPATQVASGTLIAGETLWSCGTAGCTTRQITARPAVACAQVARKVGTISSFTVGGTALSAEDLTKCNAKAKGATALAAK